MPIQMIPFNIAKINVHIENTECENPKYKPTLTLGVTINYSTGKGLENWAKFVIIYFVSPPVERV